MTIYAKRINGKQRSWLKKYEDETTFEPLYQEELDSGAMMFDEVARYNIDWFEEGSRDVHSRVSNNVPYIHIS